MRLSPCRRRDSAVARCGASEPQSEKPYRTGELETSGYCVGVSSESENSKFVPYGASIVNAMLCVSLFMPWVELSTGKPLLGFDFMFGSHPRTVSGLVDLVAWLVIVALLVSATFDRLPRLRGTVKAAVIVLQVVAGIAVSITAALVGEVGGMGVGGGLLLSITALFASVVVWSQRPLRGGDGVWEPTSKRDKWLRPRGSDDSGAIV